MFDVPSPHPAFKLDVEGATVEIATRAEVTALPQWQTAFSSFRKDRRYYEIVEETIQDDFEYGYFVIKNGIGEVTAIQPFFVIDQDILAGVGSRFKAIVASVRRFFPRFLRVRTLMVGCAAGEGHLDGPHELHEFNAKVLSANITPLARALNASIIVLKEFPAKYRDVLQCFRACGFARVPSMPMTRLNIEYAGFEDYLDRVLSARTRGKLRRKLRKTARLAPELEMTVVCDATPFVEKIYPLYLDVFKRSSLQFERLSKQYFEAVGRHMPDKARFFIWRRRENIVAFALYLVNGSSICSEYIGFDYRVAFDLSLYYVVFRDTMEWGIANGYKWFGSTGLNYDPKLHLRQLLDPLDLYVRHTSSLINGPLRWVLPWIEPTRYDKTLRQFPNYRSLWN